MTTSNSTYKKLKDCSLEELKALYEKNRDFASVVYDKALEMNLLQQGDLWEDYLGKDNKGISYHDHYSSFYLRVSDPETFVKSLPEHYEDSTEKIKTLYKKCLKFLAMWEEMDYEDQQSDKGEAVYALLEENSELLLAEIEHELHTFEDVSDCDIETTLGEIVEGWHSMSEWKTDGKAVYEEIVKIYQ